MVKDLDVGIFARTTDDIFSLTELKTKLQNRKQLRIKYGVDVTAPFLHIGHAVNLWMMRRFQEHGHKVVFLVGDFTTRIGDPTGKSAARKVPSRAEIEVNAQQFIEQVGTVLLTDPAVFEVRRNSEWFDVMGTDQFLSLLSAVTHARLIARDMFQRRIKEGSEIYMNEMLYPILQGYDSYMLESDLTIVGSDQLFNEMMGRFFQEKFSQAPQIVMTTKITPGTDGKEKQSKTLGNYIALADTPRDKFGKIMSIPDSLIVPYFEVYTDTPLSDISAIADALRSNSENPMVFKKQLGQALVARYHGDETGRAEREWFETAFSKRETPTDIPSLPLKASQITALELVTLAMPTLSKSEARRLVRQNAVTVADAKIAADGENQSLSLKTGDLLQIGKKNWFKIVVE